MLRSGVRPRPGLLLCAAAVAFGWGGSAAPAGPEVPRVRPAPARPPGTQGAGISWLRDFSAARAEARQKERPLMIEFWADWCGPCHMLEQHTFSDAKVIEASRRFVAVSVDFDRNQKLAAQFDVVALPAVLLTDSYGTEILRLNGFVGPRQFLDLLGRVPADVRPFNELSRRLKDRPRDFQALLDLGLLFRRQSLLDSSIYYLQEAVRVANSPPQAPAQLEEALFYLGENHLQEEEWTSAVAAFAALLERFPSGARAPIAHLEIGKAYIMTGEKERAREHLTPLLNRGEDDRVAREARQVLGKI